MMALDGHCVWNRSLLFLTVNLYLVGGVWNSNNKLNDNVTYLLGNLINKTKYDRQLRPGFGGAPVIIDVNMQIRSLGPVSESDQTYSLDCYFRQHWNDDRLRFNTSNKELKELHMNWQFLDMVWKPDTYFLNGHKSHLHKITVPNRFIRIRSDGRLTYSMRLTIKASCPMSLRKFPLDHQACPLEIGSYGYTMKDVIYKWDPLKEKKVELDEGLNLAQYELVNITYDEFNKTITRIASFGPDLLSILHIQFNFRRHTGYFLLQVYVPCGLIVSCSWVSFWIDQEAVPARVALGVTTALTMTTIGFGQNRSGIPQVSYATALDWFVIMCFAFVFASMLEFASINFIEQKMRKSMAKQYQELVDKMQRNLDVRRGYRSTRSTDFFVNEVATGSNSFFGLSSVTLDVVPVGRCSCVCDHSSSEIPLEHHKFSTIDIYARKLFPLSFIILTIIYCITYMYILSDELPETSLAYTTDLPHAQARFGGKQQGHLNCD